MLEQSPLEAAPGILAADLARDGPRVCDAVVRALADDADLRRIEPGGWHGAPMTATLGVAVLREDGLDPDSLIEAAEEARFAASASGLPVMPGESAAPEAPNGGTQPPADE